MAAGLSPSPPGLLLYVSQINDNWDTAHTCQDIPDGFVRYILRNELFHPKTILA
jgi:hypothetical protein